MTNYEVENAKQLVGFKIAGVIFNVGGSFGLRCTKGSQELLAWVDCDPEGNGPGHLNIEKKKKNKIDDQN